MLLGEASAGKSIGEKQPILTPCWNCFFDLLFIAFVIIIICNRCLKGPCPSVWLLKVPFFRTLSSCRWQEGRNERIPCLRLAILGDVCKINGLFLCFLTSPYLWSIKEPGIWTPIRSLFWGTSLPSSQSASFLNKVIFLVSTPHLSDSLACHGVSRASLDSMTRGPEPRQASAPGPQSIARPTTAWLPLFLENMIPHCSSWRQLPFPGPQPALSASAVGPRVGRGLVYALCLSRKQQQRVSSLGLTWMIRVWSEFRVPR